MKKTILLLFLCLSSLFGEQLIGQYDRVDIPLLELYDLEAKIDTGAKSSSLHCSEIKELNDELVEFIVLGPSRKLYAHKKFTLPIERIAFFKSSNGIVQRRVVVNLDLILFGKSFTTEVSLSERKEMQFPLLLGRNLLMQGFLVDVTKDNISYKQKQAR